MEDGCAHFGADASSLVSKAYPGTGVDLTQDRVVAGGDRLLTDDLAVLEDRDTRWVVERTTAAHAFLTLRRLDPKVEAPA
ncbi:hypothetical protein [Streptomyces kaniharaensis]|uniref:hypothetical protein n=1 Tax=Streptomyces kaniharaensis TaxID=212423 RepID=UPI001295ECB1|nr:hypothetical protein [Streptomyces kaniharaensis]